MKYDKRFLKKNIKHKKYVKEGWEKIKIKKRAANANAFSFTDR